MQTVWDETDEKMYAITREYVWGDSQAIAIGAAINVHNLFTHIDENGEPLPPRRSPDWPPAAGAIPRFSPYCSQPCRRHMPVTGAGGDQHR